MRVVFSFGENKTIIGKIGLENRVCNICLIEQSLDNFYSWNKNRSARMPRCKKCHQEKQKESRIKYSVSKYYTKLRLEKKLFAVKYKGSKCVDCDKEYHHSIYDFHHLDPSIKENSVAVILSRGRGNLIKELDKCVLLCANCHRFRHFKEGNETSE